MGVVVVDVDAQDALELPAAGDQDPVEAVAADGTDPAFRECVCLWRAKWGADDLDAFAAENIVEVAAELAVTIVDQEAVRCRSSGERPRKLSGLLGDPASVGVGGATCEVHAPAADLEEEDHIEAAEPERVDGKEIAGDNRLGVRAQELAPAELGASAGRGYACLSEDLGDRRCRDAYADTGELADDPLVTPTRVFTRKPQHQLTDLLGDRGSTGSPSGIRPPPAYELPMPAQQCVRADEERRSTRSAEESVSRGQEDAVALVQPWPLDLAAKDREFVPQHDDLELLELARAQPQRRHRKRTPK